MGPNPMTGVLRRTGKSGNRSTKREGYVHTQKEDGHVRMEEELRLMLPQPQNILGDQKMPE